MEEYRDEEKNIPDSIGQKVLSVENTYYPWRVKPGRIVESSAPKHSIEIVKLKSVLDNQNEHCVEDE